MEVTVFRLLRATAPPFFRSSSVGTHSPYPESMYFRLILTDFPHVPIVADLRLLTEQKTTRAPTHES